jgi:GT2 family glycosyltransferase
MNTIIVDNASSDGSFVELESKFPNCHFIRNEINFGFAKGNNIGIECALNRGAEYVLIINNDVEVEHNFLFPLVSYLENHLEVAAVSPLIYHHPEKSKVWFSGGSVEMPTFFTKHNLLKISEPCDTGFLTGCCILFRSSILKTVGLFNEKFFAYFEDVDLSLRILHTNHKLVVVPESVIYHKVSQSFKKGDSIRSPLTFYLTIRNGIFLRRIHAHGNLAISIVSYLLFSLKYILGFLFLLRFDHLRKSLRGIIDGFKGKL